MVTRETLRKYFEAFEGADVILDLMEQEYDKNPNEETEKALYMAVEEWTATKTILINGIYKFLGGTVERKTIEIMLHQKREELKEIINR